MSVTFDPKFIKFSKTSSSTLLTGLVAYWNFDESSGTLVDEVSGYVGTGTGIVYNASGILSRCVEYDTNTDNVSVDNNSGFVPNSDVYSVSIWIKLDILPSTAARSYTLFRIYDTTGSTAVVSISLPSDDNYVGFYTWNTVPVEYQVESDMGVLSTGSWYHIVCINNGSGIDGTIYVNNTDVTNFVSASFSGNLHGAPTGTTVIGNSPTSTTAAIDGCVDEVGLWRKALTSTEVASLYNSGTGITYPFS